MKSLWNNEEASHYETDLKRRVYTSRLLGQDSTLVLHGGGNTSVKIIEKNIFGQEEQILYVKGSGWDLIDIDIPGFAPVKLDHLLNLAKLDHLSDQQMMNELKTNCLLANAPTPSVEAILHAILPYKYVDHTHADAIITLTNTTRGLDYIKEVFGNKVVIVPYIMPGFDLAKHCAQQFPQEQNEATMGMILMQHGIFSFGNTAQESYQRMIELVDLAETFLKSRDAWHITMPQTSTPTSSSDHPVELATLRKEISTYLERPAILMTSDDPADYHFARHSDITNLSQQGPATPDHVIRTKRVPMLGRDVNEYTQQYQNYFDTHSPQAKQTKTILDPAPRIILDPIFGLVTVGRTVKDAKIAKNIYQHTRQIILRSNQLCDYRALDEPAIFDMEYWDLEQAKLKNSKQARVFTGEIALVTGAASGIGKACVNSLLAHGAAVIGIDIKPDVIDVSNDMAYFGITCDVTQETQVINAIQKTTRQFGGLDMIILCAGRFPLSTPIAELSSQQWRATLNLNLDANLTLMREAQPLLLLAPNGGRIVLIGSKNVPAPGPGAAAYSAAKAALTQLGRVAALEWGKHNIRINTLHPDAVFDTGIWTDDIIASRAEAYGLSIDEYKTKNILKTTISSHDVAELATAMCGPLFAKTTAAQIPIDGGNDRVV